MDRRLKSEVEKAARILKEAGAREVFIFGSAAEGRGRQGSDIDFAVRGIPPRLFFEAVGKLVISLSSDFDLVDLEEQSPFVCFGTKSVSRSVQGTEPH